MPTAIQDTLDEMVFEHFSFAAYCTRPAQVLAALAVKHEQKEREQQSPATLIVDIGYSATHCVPIFGGCALNFGIRRLNLGGKLLTNHLKQIISYRSYNVMDETHLMNDVKQRLCHVSLDFAADLALTRFKGKKNTLRREYVMPDYVNHREGRIRNPNEPAPAAAPAAAPEGKSPGARGEGPPPKKKLAASVEEQVLMLSSERISVPELLFNPSDIGVEQAGVSECVIQAVEACIPDLRGPLLANVVLTGGSARFANFEERLRRELREIAPAEYEVGVSTAAEPNLAAWRGGSLFAASEAYPSQLVTREQYHEHGHSLCRRRFLEQSC